MSSSICLKLVSFLQNAAIHPLATNPIVEGRGPTRRKVPSRDGYPRRSSRNSPASVGDEKPSSTVHLASTKYADVTRRTRCQLPNWWWVGALGRVRIAV